MGPGREEGGEDWVGGVEWGRGVGAKRGGGWGSRVEWNYYYEGYLIVKCYYYC